jgi:hypothetical protein
VLKNLRFELRFDDPRQPDDKRLAIRGDAGELEMLYEAVNSYVQGFLESSPTQLPLISRTPTAATGSTPNESPGHNSLGLPASGVMNSDAIASQSLYQKPDKFDDSALGSNLELNPKRRSLKSRSLATDIYLEPKGLLAHNLFLGHLATEESGPFVNLSVTQLFDLATALDEYAAEAVALPAPNGLSWKKGAPTWAYTAAAVVAAVGVTATTMKLLDRPKTQTVATTASQPPSPTPSPTAQVTPSPNASIALLPTPTVPLPLSTAPTLPPPSRVNIPSAPTSLNLPLGSQRSTDSPLGNQRPTTTIRINPPEPATVQPKRSSIPVFPGGIASSRPSPSSTASSPTISLSKRSPSPSSPEKAPSEKAPAQKAPTRTNKPSESATPPPLPELPSLNPNTSTASNPGDQALPPASARTASSTAESNQSTSAPTDTDSKTTLFDTIPQVKEVRDYLQQQWKPASDLTQILEYYVFLNPDGKVERIIPLNKAAEENLNRTNIPRSGDPFVSPVEGEGNPKIRVVFSPDGKVQTFYEGREEKN